MASLALTTRVSRPLIYPVLDLDGVLVKSDWNRERGWRTFKRPGVDAFLKHMAQYYEVVVFTELLATYGDPILERLDPGRCGLEV